MNIDYINKRLTEMSAVVIDGVIVTRLDHLAYICIDNQLFINVYRRYNSPFDIVIVCNNNEIIAQTDGFVIDSVMNAFYLTQEQLSLIQCMTVHSMKYNMQLFDHSILNRKWSDIHQLYTSVSINMFGLLNASPQYQEEQEEQEQEQEQEAPPPLTPVKVKQELKEEPPQQTPEYRNKKDRESKKRKRDVSPVPMNTLENDEESDRKYYCLRNKRQRKH